jgi:hypothetical protein
MLNKQNNKSNDISINTKGITLYNKEGFEPSVLVLGFWNDLISIKLHPALEKSKQTENKIFDYEISVVCTLNMEKAIVLSNAIENIILPAIKNDEDKTVSVTVGGDSLLAVGTGKALTGKIRPFLAIYKTLDPDTRKPASWLHYEFTNTELIVDYDKGTGAYGLEYDTLTQLTLFLNFIKSSIVGMSQAIAHSMAYSSRFTNEKTFNTIAGIAGKLGLEVAGKKPNSGYKKNNINWGSQPQLPDTSSDQEEVLDSLEGYDL